MIRIALKIYKCHVLNGYSLAFVRSYCDIRVCEINK